MRIFKTVLSVFLIVIFIALLVSSYNRYSLTLATAGLVDTASSVANHLVLDRLAHESRRYVVDPGKISSLESFREEVGGENFGFQLILFRKIGEGEILKIYGPNPPEGRAFCALSIPVILYENYRYEFAKLEVKLWRA